jgi:hypothetical protein
VLLLEGELVRLQEVSESWWSDGESECFDYLLEGLVVLV